MNESTSAYDLLRGAFAEPVEIAEPEFRPHPAYEQYLRMHKIIVGEATSHELIQISHELSNEMMPRYLVTAGWAAAEAALITNSLPTKERFSLLDQSADCWERAMRNQLHFNLGERPHLIDNAGPFRSALDLASLPLLRGMVAGDVTKQSSVNSFEDCLSIAEANILQLELALKEGDMSAVSDHIGLGYECNALLALNRLQSQSWFAIPAVARADTGYYHGRQTHDLLVIRQKRGEIQSVIPVEVKSHTSLKDRNRYQALLVRGKMHLTLQGRNSHMPHETLAGIGAVHRGEATPRQHEDVKRISNTFMSMLRDYYAGSYLGDIALDRVQPFFRDNSQVIARHPGLSLLAQQR